MKRSNQQRTQRKQEALQRQLAVQDGKCGLCRRAQAKRWHYDHDHETGGLRLVLCSKCNNGLGFFDDDPLKLVQAAQYIQRHRPLRPVNL